MLAQSGGPIIIDGSTEAPDLPIERSLYSEHNPSHGNPTTTPSYDIGPLGIDQYALASEYYDRSEELEYAERAPIPLPNVLQFGQFPAREPVGTGARPVQQHNEHPPASRSQPPADRQQMGIDTNGLGIELHPLPVQMPALQTVDLATGNQPPVKTNPPNLHESSLTGILKPVPLLSPVREVRTPSPTKSRANNSHINLGPQQIRPHHSRSISMLSSGEGHASSPLAGPAYVQAWQNGNPAGSQVIVQSGGSGSFAERRGSANGYQAPMNGAAGHSGAPYINGDSSRSNELATRGPAQAPQQQHPGSQASGWQQAGSNKRKQNKKKHGSIGSIPLPSETGQRKGG